MNERIHVIRHIYAVLEFMYHSSSTLVNVKQHFCIQIDFYCYSMNK